MTEQDQPKDTMNEDEMLEPISDATMDDDSAEGDSALAEAQKRADDNWDKYMRLQAEMENLRRRSERDVSHAHKYGSEKLIKDVLPVLESLEHGLAMPVTSDDKHLASLREGMELTHKLFLDVLKKHGVTQINPEGVPFNAAQMEAISAIPNDNVEPNTVLTVVQKGYSLNERLLKAAMVVVSRAS